MKAYYLWGEVHTVCIEEVISSGLDETLSGPHHAVTQICVLKPKVIYLEGTRKTYNRHDPRLKVAHELNATIIFLDERIYKSKRYLLMSNMFPKLTKTYIRELRETAWLENLLQHGDGFVVMGAAHVDGVKRKLESAGQQVVVAYNANDTMFARY